MHAVKFSMYGGLAKITDPFKRKEDADHYAAFLNNVGIIAEVEEVKDGQC